MAGAGRVVSINVSPQGGVPKHPVDSAFLGTCGMAGDRQADLRYHGGPDRAVALYPLEVIEALRIEGHPISPGSTGENLTISGLEWGFPKPGMQLRVGHEILLQLTRYVTPCHKIAGSFKDGDFTRIAVSKYPDWCRLYARVLAEGMVRVGDEIVIL